MTSYRVAFTADAEADLDAVYAHIATSAGTTRADAVVGSLSRACLALNLFPHRCSPRVDLLPGLSLLPGLRAWWLGCGTRACRSIDSR